MKSRTLILALLFPLVGHSQTLDSRSAQIIDLTGGVRIKVFSSLEEPTQYYYVPLTLQLSQGKGGIPEISMMVYREKDSGISGGILHALFTWGLNSRQHNEAVALLQRKDSLAALVGPAEIKLETGEVACDGSDAFFKDLVASSKMPMKLPTESIHKTAVSFSLSRELASELERLATKGGSKTNNFLGSYRYVVYSRSKGGSRGVEVTDEMVLPLSVMMKALKEYRLIKYVNL